MEMDCGANITVSPIQSGMNTDQFLTSRSSCDSLLATDTVHIDMPNKSDGTLSKVPILLQMPEELRSLGDSRDLEVLDDTMDLSKFDESSADGDSLLSPTFLDKINLEDFVDVVTTYRCKFCRFSCAWKSGLMSHIRNAHIRKSLSATSLPSANNTSPMLSLLPANPSTAPTSQKLSVTTSTDAGDKLAQPIDVSILAPLEAEPNPLNVLELGEFHEQFEEVPMLTTSDDNFQVAPVQQEKQIFLCGSCHQGFQSLEVCKSHILLEHQLPVESTEQTVNKLSKRKTTRLRRKRQCFDFQKEEQKKTIENDNDEVEPENDGTLSKRKVRLPRALSEDLYLLSRKRKYSRRQPLEDKASFRCEFENCNVHFRSEENLNYHVRCHKDGERQFQCIECVETSQHWRIMALHLWKEHQLDLDLYACLVCGYRTCSSFKLENHSRIHGEERSFVCGVCRKGFKQMSQLKNHQVVHVDRKNLKEKRWFCEQKCEICFRKFSDSKCLRKHMQAVHNKVKPYSCSFCGHMSARKAMLQLHMRCHTGEKPFVCDMCDYRTGDHNSLRRHKMRHSGAKPYKCRHCNYACIQAISYKTHMKNKHPNNTEGLFCCTLCSFRSVSEDNYINHMSDHKRGVIPLKIAPIEPEIPSTTASISDMAQLECMLPGNPSAAQLIYSCLNALSQQVPGELPPGVSTTTDDGTQTITIQIPNEMGGADSEADHIYLTIQQPQASEGQMEGDEVNVELEETADKNQQQLESEQAQVLLDSLNKVEFTTAQY